MVLLINEPGNVMEGINGETSHYLKVKFVGQLFCNHRARGWGRRLVFSKLEKGGQNFTEDYTFL
jgi:hypothetical protein